MAVVSMMRMRGDPDDLLERLQKHVVPVGERRNRGTEAWRTWSPVPTTGCSS